MALAVGARLWAVGGQAPLVEAATTTCSSHRPGWRPLHQRWRTSSSWCCTIVLTVGCGILTPLEGHGRQHTLRPMASDGRLLQRTCLDGSCSFPRKRHVPYAGLEVVFPLPAPRTGESLLVQVRWSCQAVHKVLLDLREPARLLCGKHELERL